MRITAAGVERVKGHHRLERGWATCHVTEARGGCIKHHGNPGC
jgi:hypothetical protein